jgi:hypothetical protein
MIMCRMTRPCGNLQRAGVTGHTLTRTVSDLRRSCKAVPVTDAFLRRDARIGPPRMSASGRAYARCWHRIAVFSTQHMAR